MAESLPGANVILLIAVTISTEIGFHIHVMMDVPMKLHAEKMACGFLKHQHVVIVRAYRIMLF